MVRENNEKLVKHVFYEKQIFRIKDNYNSHTMRLILFLKTNNITNLMNFNIFGTRLYNIP